MHDSNVAALSRAQRKSGHAPRPDQSRATRESNRVNGGWTPGSVSIFQAPGAARNHKISRGFIAVVFREDNDAELHGIQRAAMYFGLQLVAGNLGSSVSLRQFDNVLKIPHDSTQRLGSGIRFGEDSTNSSC